MKLAPFRISRAIVRGLVLSLGSILGRPILAFHTAWLRAKIHAQELEKKRLLAKLAELESLPPQPEDKGQ